MVDILIPDALLQASAPGNLDIILVPGATKVVPVAFTDVNGNAITLTGVTGTCQIRSAPGGTVLCAGTVSVASNVATITFAAVDTLALVPLVPPSDDPLQIREPLKCGVWDLKLSGTVQKCVPVAGTAYVVEKITA